MKITGIVVEYNPLHNGHLYHIKETIKRSQCDLLIAVMSGNFVMRGEPAMLNKQIRADLALKSGVDLVVELPYPFSVASADLFAFGAISVLNHLNVSEIYFGSESDDVNTLTEIAKIIDTEPFNQLLKLYLNQGIGYPKACEQAIRTICPMDVQFHSNDILGIQYIRSILKINNRVQYHTIKRVHNQYNDTHFSHNSIASATSIRHALSINQPIHHYVPSYTLEALTQQKLVTWNDFFPYLKYQIISNQNNLHLIHDVHEGIERAIIHNIHQFTCFNDFIASLVSKRYTTSKIKRMLTHILNNVTKDEVNTNQIEAIRLLGVNKEKSNYLREIKPTIPLITNIDKNNYKFVKLEERISEVYHLVDLNKPRKIPIFQDYS